MVMVKAVRGLRPKKEFAAKVASPPYDVLSADEARVLAADNPISFLYVEKMEINLPPGADADGEEAALAGKKSLQRLIDDQVMVQDAKECIYVYRLTWRGRQQTGFMLLSAADDYLKGNIKRHEYTRADKEAGRTRLEETMNAQAGPVFLFYPSATGLDALLAEIASGSPEYDFEADEVRHQLWVASDHKTVQRVVDGFAKVNATYIADGHHRCAAAVNVCKNRRSANPGFDGSEPFNYFLTVIFPSDQLRILSYNRVVKDLNGLSPNAFVQQVKARFIVEPETSGKPVESDQDHVIGMYLEGKWYRLMPLSDSFNKFDPIERLDASVLSRNLLDPILGITNPRTDKRIDFVGGIRGTAELVKLVDSGKFKVAFSMPPVTMQALKDVADSGGVMPPKSTWFEPKLRSGLVVYQL
jgi:uncharacterized protein (DUF1015 family)